MEIVCQIKSEIANRMIKVAEVYETSRFDKPGSRSADVADSDSELTPVPEVNVSPTP